MTQHEQDTLEGGALRHAAKVIKLSVNLTAADVEAVDAVVEQHRPYLRRHAIHLAALRIGIRELRDHPQHVIDHLQHEQQRRGQRA